jgi:hypothetical protein
VLIGRRFFVLVGGSLFVLIGGPLFVLAMQTRGKVSRKNDPTDAYNLSARREL